MSILELFPDLVSPEPNSGCWLWEGPLMDGKYGGVYVGGVRKYTHRLSSEISHGPLEKSVRVLHHCDVHCCVNPDHLFRGDQLDNMQDMAAKGRRSRISAETVREIRRLYAAGGVSQMDLASKFGIGQTTVCGLVSGSRRRYV